MTDEIGGEGIMRKAEAGKTRKAAPLGLRLAAVGATAAGQRGEGDMNRASCIFVAVSEMKRSTPRADSLMLHVAGIRSHASKLIGRRDAGGLGGARSEQAFDHTIVHVSIIGGDAAQTLVCTPYGQKENSTSCGMART